MVTNYDFSKGITNEAKLMCEWMREHNELIFYLDPDLPNNIFHGVMIRETTFDLMVSIVEDSSSYSANTAAVPSPDRSKLKREGHKTEKTERKKKNKKRIPKVNILASVTLFN